MKLAILDRQAANAEELPSPKRRSTGGTALPLMDFYAGFSLEFACAIAERLRRQGVRRALDPFVGCGTAAAALSRVGIRVHGFDLHPVQVLYARARCLATADDFQAAAQILRPAGPARSRNSADPLSAWFDDRSVSLFREAEKGLRHATGVSAEGAIWERVDAVTSGEELAGVVLLFSVTRWLARRGASSNPTWFRPRPEGERIAVTQAAWRAAVDACLVAALRGVGNRPEASIEISRGTAFDLPLAAGKMDAVFTSPPYCTRLDYVKASLPELALLRAPVGDGMRDLRLAMMGTVLVRDVGPGCPALPASALRVMDEVSDHPSKDSSGYYLKFFRQYLTDLLRFAHECKRVLRSDGRVVMVLQDSFYKDVRIPVADLAADVFALNGFEVRDAKAFPARRTWQHLNPASRRYRDPIHHPREWVLWLEKERER